MSKLAKILSVLLVTVTFVAFQNCAKVSDNNLVTTDIVVSQKFQAAETQFMKVFDSDNSRFLEINMIDGEILTVEQFGENQADDIYCLPPKELTAVKNIVISAQYCQSEGADASTQSEMQKPELCAQVYTFPYAILVKEANEIRLGEMHTSCDTTVDLCADRGAALRKFTAELVTNLKNYPCEAGQ